MITKFKIFENIDTYIIDKVDKNEITSIDSIFEYLEVEFEYTEDAIPTSKYGVDVIEFIKEIFLGKKLFFESINRSENDPSIEGIITDVKYYGYKDSLHINVKIENNSGGWKWYLIKNYPAIFIEYYDADTKPLHKEVELKKEAEKYNL